LLKPRKPATIYGQETKENFEHNKKIVSKFLVCTFLVHFFTRETALIQITDKAFQRLNMMQLPVNHPRRMDKHL
jgi:hypothetical protein